MTKLNIHTVKLLYFGKNLNMHQMAAELGVTIREVRDFCIKNHITKDSREYMNYIQSRGRIETVMY